MKSFYSVKKICCIGAGYVGGPTMAVIASNCPNLIINVVDINKERIKNWNSLDFANLPVYEPGLDKIIEKCRDVNLFFSTDIERCISEADVVFLSVNTPTKIKGIGAGKASDLKWIEASARQVAKHSRGHTIVVEKSTIPVRTADTIKQILFASQEIDLGKKRAKTFSVLSNPEFLAEGSAIDDLQNPERVLIGGEDDKAMESLKFIYSHWIDSKKNIENKFMEFRVI